MTWSSVATGLAGLFEVVPGPCPTALSGVSLTYVPSRGGGVPTLSTGLGVCAQTSFREPGFSFKRDRSPKSSSNSDSYDHCLESNTDG